MALTRPRGHRIRTNSVPEVPRSRGARRKPSHESCGSVSTTDTPSTCLQPDSSQPIAVTAAVEAAGPAAALEVGHIETD